MISTKPNRTAIMKVIHRAAQAKSLIDGFLFQKKADNTECKSPGRCAVGEMLFSVGVPNEKIAKMGGGPGGHFWTQKVYQKLWTKFRVDASDLSEIISANDSVNGCDVSSLEEREATIRRRVDNLSDSRTRVNPFVFQVNTLGKPKGVLYSKGERNVLKRLGVRDMVTDLLIEQVG